ncbi:integral membrane protein [Niveomyces insectorum RCEF 264]|uniref:Integral membrane protein n=1 Tax=Niveomyces insectorum RCEF 264 TaxID=1081102 RepID=A0A167XQ14_9HYPO|nr:integral membrane protein [Niveomyces insectorum RCEF 264]
MARRRRPRRSGALTELPPLKILGQIAVLQAIFYSTAAPLMLFTALVSGRPFSADLVLGWQAVRGDTTQGWLVAFIWLLAGGLFGSLAIVVFVSRSKLVLDFALTLHAIHLCVVVLYTGTLPANLAWWVTMALSSGLAVALGTWGCRYRELRPIAFGGRGGGSAAAGATGGAAGAGHASGETDGGSPAGAGAGSDDVGDEEQGFSRGRGRGRGRDGGGHYEMVPIKKNGENSRQD